MNDIFRKWILNELGELDPNQIPTGQAGEQIQSGTGYVTCSDPNAIYIYKQWLKYAATNKTPNLALGNRYGPVTHQAAQRAYNDQTSYEDIKKQGNRICSHIAKNKDTFIRELKAINITPGPPATSSTTGQTAVKGSSEQNPFDNHAELQKAEADLGQKKQLNNKVLYYREGPSILKATYDKDGVWSNTTSSGIVVFASSKSGLKPGQKVKESKMNNKLRQKILKELNYLLREDESRTGQYVAGTAVGAGATATGIMSAGLAATAGGAPLYGAGLTVGGLLLPVAIGAAAIGALYLAFRTAGWQEVVEDIRDAKDTMTNRPELAQKLPTGKYFDLTTMTDATDKKDFMSLVSAMKGIQDRMQTLQNVDEYNQFLEVLKTYKPDLDLICGVDGGVSKGSFFLLNEFGLNDRLYHLKCAKLDLKVVPQELLNQPVTATATNIKEQILKELKLILKEADEDQSFEQYGDGSKQWSGGTADLPASTSTGKCATYPEIIYLPVELRDNIGLEDEVADSPVPIPDPNTPPLPPITCPTIDTLCGVAPKPDTDGGDTPTPTPEPIPTPAPNVKCVRCDSVGKGCKGKDVAEIQQILTTKLGYEINQAEISNSLFGSSTEKAVISFQRKQGWKGLGVVGKLTCNALGITKKGKGGKKKKDTPVPTPDTTPQPKPELGSDGKPLIDPNLKPLPVVKDPVQITWEGQNYLKFDSRKHFEDYLKFNPDGIKGKNVIYQNGKKVEFGISEQPKTTLEAGSDNTVWKALGVSPPLAESNKFNHQKYYDHKKQNEAKLLFEKLIKNMGK